jgi:hypothetical protein
MWYQQAEGYKSETAFDRVEVRGDPYARTAEHRNPEAGQQSEQKEQRTHKTQN